MRDCCEHLDEKAIQSLPSPLLLSFGDGVKASKDGQVLSMRHGPDADVRYRPIPEKLDEPLGGDSGGKKQKEPEAKIARRLPGRRGLGGRGGQQNN